MIKQVLELFADLEHERWSKWMRWMFDNWTEDNIVCWKRQMNTSYKDLSEKEKESDRIEARRSLLLLGEVIKQEGR